MKTIAVIPARGGSKRVPDKNLQKIGELTLTEHAITTALACNMDGEPLFDNIIVSSDSSRILSDAEKYDGVDIHLRSDYAASDDADDSDVLLNVLEQYDADLIVYLRPSTPFRTVSAVTGAISRMKQVHGISGLRSVHEMSETAYKCCCMRPGNILEPMAAYYLGGKMTMDEINAPSQQFATTYHPNGVVDIMRMKTIERGKLFGDEVLGWITKPVIEIDTEHDLLMARVLFAYQLQPQDFFKIIGG